MYIVSLLFGESRFQIVELAVVITGRSVPITRTAGPKIACFPRLFVCLFVRPHLSRAQYITSYITMQLQYIAAWRFTGQATANEGTCAGFCPHWSAVVGSNHHSAF